MDEKESSAQFSALMVESNPELGRSKLSSEQSQIRRVSQYACSGVSGPVARDCCSATLEARARFPCLLRTRDSPRLERIIDIEIKSDALFARDPVTQLGESSR